jgi:hypothetical protein
MRRVIGWILAGVGVASIAGSFILKGPVADSQIKYPDDLDETPVYEGTVSIFLDPATKAPLAEPVVLPLKVERNIRSVSATSDEVVVQERIKLAAEGEGGFAGELNAQYVMDRKEAVNVASDEAWAFMEANAVDRADAYRLAFPFDTPTQPFTIYKNEVDATYTAEPAGEGEVEGLTVINFKANQDEPLPITPAYKAELDKLVPLPNELTLDELKPILKQAGLDIDAILPQLLAPGALSGEDVEALVALAGQPVKLQYVYTFSGDESVEPTTGAAVKVSNVEETLWATPDPAATAALKGIFDKYPDLEVAQTASAALEKVAAEPIKVFTNAYSQTDESVADIASTVKDNKTLIDLVQNTLPMALLIGGIVLAVAGLLLALWPKKKVPAAPAPAV